MQLLFYFMALKWQLHEPIWVLTVVKCLLKEGSVVCVLWGWRFFATDPEISSLGIQDGGSKWYFSISSVTKIVNGSKVICTLDIRKAYSPDELEHIKGNAVLLFPIGTRPSQTQRAKKKYHPVLSHMPSLSCFHHPTPLKTRAYFYVMKWSQNTFLLCNSLPPL